jgi:hypothetical protein
LEIGAHRACPEDLFPVNKQASSWLQAWDVMTYVDSITIGVHIQQPQVSRSTDRDADDCPLIST